MKLETKRATIVKSIPRASRKQTRKRREHVFLSQHPLMSVTRQLYAVTLKRVEHTERQVLLFIS
jgi:hypothetical protein